MQNKQNVVEQEQCSPRLRDDHYAKAKEKAACTCLTELEQDAYGPGGPMSGKVRPSPCKVHPRTGDQSNG